MSERKQKDRRPNPNPSAVSATIEEILSLSASERLSRDDVAALLGRTRQMVSYYTVRGYADSGIRLRGFVWLGDYVYLREWVAEFMHAIHDWRTREKRLGAGAKGMRTTKREERAVRERLKHHGIG